MSVQMRLDLMPAEQPDEPTEVPGKPTPGNCPHEVTVVDMSGKGSLKSECDLTYKKLGHNMWTSCRVWGSCTLWGDPDAL